MNLPALEEELVRGGWFMIGADPRRAAIANCIASVGTPAAQVLLERHARSRQPLVRRACEDALRENPHHG